MHQCLIFRSKAREEVEQEKSQPAKTRQASLVHDDVRGEEQPEVVGLGEEPEEEQTVCPKGSRVHFWIIHIHIIEYIVV